MNYIQTDAVEEMERTSPSNSHRFRISNINYYQFFSISIHKPSPIKWDSSDRLYHFVFWVNFLRLLISPGILVDSANFNRNLHQGHGKPRLRIFFCFDEMNFNPILLLIYIFKFVDTNWEVEWKQNSKYTICVHESYKWLAFSQVDSTSVCADKPKRS